jgi:hypothetical protein
LGDQIKKNETGEASKLRAEIRGAYRILVGIPKRRPPGRPRHRWEVNIKIDIQEVDERTWNVLIWLKIGTGGGRGLL